MVYREEIWGIGILTWLSLTNNIIALLLSVFEPTWAGNCTRAQVELWRHQTQVPSMKAAQKHASKHAVEFGLPRTQILNLLLDMFPSFFGQEIHPTLHPFLAVVHLFLQKKTSIALKMAEFREHQPLHHHKYR